MPQLFSIGKAAKQLGVSIKTLRDWDKKGLINFTTTPGGHRRIEESEINRFC
ncbi:MerR family transcriptional regulator [Clostridium formicaceticum]|uniref:MerR family regulatory protein n=1 Tax=Clostridium formicaceticum TaxID=1497 RepID=A0AAC9RGR7_9CLOT|nr:helix-turn-helix domain-containing protein [Clostridium formicaceticum]ARE85706.1 MerR family regulatory protein [Clostridium formicaceticum]